MKELLSETVLEVHGAFRKVRRIWKGICEDIPGGVVIDGWTGKETKQVVSGVWPTRTFIVEGKKD